MMAAYLQMLETGELERRVGQAYELLKCCNLCPRECGVDRTLGETGFCRAGMLPAVSSHNSHHGEEPPVSGSRGSGTIFLTNCNLRCIFCQNYPISQLGNGDEVSVERLAEMMLSLQERGCHNINFVTPTHYMPQILRGVLLAVRAGLRVPLVWNCGGYESLVALRILDGVVDIYMPDAKYGLDENAERYSSAPGYHTHNRVALKEMYRQVGPLEMDDDGIAERGLIIRHLVLPNGVSRTREVFRFIAEELGTDVFMSIMEQYFPANRAADVPEMSRRVSDEEYDAALEAAEEFGLERGFAQGRDDPGGC